MTSLRSARLALAFAAALTAPVLAQGPGRTIDEGTFVVTRAGGPSRTEAFKIARSDNDLIQATGQVILGDERASSSLLADSLGTPSQYMFLLKNRGATTLDVRAMARGHRLSLKSTDNKSNESMKDFPISAGQSVVLDEDMLHQLYFVALGRRSGDVQLIEPRTARAVTATLSGRGLEPIEVGGRTITATHYSLVNGSMRRDFWVDASGRVLKAEIPSLGLVATREEPPR